MLCTISVYRGEYRIRIVIIKLADFEVLLILVIKV